MIIINNQPLEAANILSEYPENSIERTVLDTMSASAEKYSFASLEQLKFELRLRKEIIKAAEALYESDIEFRVFRDSICNPAYWTRMNDGGFALKPGVRPSEAIRDIFVNSSLYGTECATAMLMIYYKALLEIFPPEAFDRIFSRIYLMNWHNIDGKLREVGWVHAARDFFPGDRRYFANPDVNPTTPEWQGENVIDLSNGLYYGHGIGRFPAQKFIEALNENRIAGADDSAYLMESAGRPDFKRLSDLYDRAHTVQ